MKRGKDEARDFSTVATLHRGFSYLPGELKLSKGYLSFMAHGRGEFWKYQLRALEREANRPGLAKKVADGESVTVFEVPLRNVVVTFNRLGSMKLAAGDFTCRKALRVMPKSLSESKTALGRASAWKKLLMRMKSHVVAAVVSLCVLAVNASHGYAQAAGQPATAPPTQPSALAPANLAKSRPKPPFDLTGTWQHDGRANTWRFVPETFTLTPEAQAHYDAGMKALKDGGVYRDDIGQCWPAGVPLIMTRVWPIAMIQLPTAIYMVSGFMNSLRIIYLDGRSHTDPDIVVRTFNGESIGRWDGDTLVVETKYFPGHHQWMDQGGASVPVSEDFHVIERFRMQPDGRLDIDYTMTDAKNWVGEWKMTKTFRRRDDTDITEVQCLPDLNDRLPATRSNKLVK